MTIEQMGPGIECARETFQFDPVVAAGYENEFRWVEEAIDDRDLFPLGEIPSAPAFIAIARSGAVYYLMERVGLLGRSIDEALIRMIEGRRSLRVWDIDLTTSP